MENTRILLIEDYVPPSPSRVHTHIFIFFLEEILGTPNNPGYSKTMKDVHDENGSKGVKVDVLRKKKKKKKNSQKLFFIFFLSWSYENYLRVCLFYAPFASSPTLRDGDKKDIWG